MKRITTILTVLTLLCLTPVFAFPINQTTVEYETNPGTNKVAYQETTPGKGTFTLTLTPTEAFGGGTQQMQGEYSVEVQTDWVLIRHKTQKNQEFTIKVKGDFQSEQGVTEAGKPVITSTGNILDSKGSEALQGENPFTLIFFRSE